MPWACSSRIQPWHTRRFLRQIDCRLVPMCHVCHNSHSFLAVSFVLHIELLMRFPLRLWFLNHLPPACESSHFMYLLIVRHNHHVRWSSLRVSNLSFPLDILQQESYITTSSVLHWPRTIYTSLFLLLKTSFITGAQIPTAPKTVIINSLDSM